MSARVGLLGLLALVAVFVWGQTTGDGWNAADFAQFGLGLVAIAVTGFWVLQDWRRSR